LPTPDPSSGIPGWFVGLFIIAVMVSIGMAIYRFTVTKSTAESLGVPADRATGLALINDEATSTSTLAAARKRLIDNV
jgi:hypothetical protein